MDVVLQMSRGTATKNAKKKRRFRNLGGKRDKSFLKKEVEMVSLGYNKCGILSI